MEISDPRLLVKKLGKNSLNSIQSQFGKIEQFLGPGDSFQFTCDRTGNCCYNRHDNPIILSVYDVFRLRQNLKVSGKEFAEKYGHALLGANSELPLMILRSEWLDKSKGLSHCVFLKGEDCSVYTNRPQVCRMYPVGRLTDTDFKSYYFLTQTSGCCRTGCGNKHTIENWLEEAGIESFVKWNDRFNELYMSMNHEKYKKADKEVKWIFGNILYDVGSPLEILYGKKKYAQMSSLNDESLLEETYAVAKEYVDILFK